MSRNGKSGKNGAGGKNGGVGSGGDDDNVGYGRPPRHSRFKPGTSGNPKGRPRKDHSIRSILKTLGNETATVPTENGDVTMTSNEWMLRSLRQRAMKGDNRATTIYLELWIDAFGPA
jgi:hypothetical protein